MNSGIAKIINPIKDRRSIIDQARDRAEANSPCKRNQVNALIEKPYQSLSEKINNSKKAAQQVLIPPGHNFKNAVARMMQIEREVGTDGKKP